MKWSVIGLVFVGLIAATCAAVLVGVLRSGGFMNLTRPGSARREVEIVVAARDIPASRIIEKEDVTVKKVPAKEAPEDVITDVVGAIGKVTTVKVVTDQALTWNEFATKGSGAELSAILEDGMRAVSLSLSDYNAVFPHLYPGCVVDVDATVDLPMDDYGRRGDSVSGTLLTKIRVLAIEQATVVSVDKEASTPEARKTRRGASKMWMVTLEVTPGQAHMIHLAQEHGKIALALRNPLDDKDMGNDTFVTLEDLHSAAGRAASGSPNSAARASSGGPFTGGFRRVLGSIRPAPRLSRPAAAAGQTVPAMSTGQGSAQGTGYSQSAEGMPSEPWRVRIIRGSREETIDVPPPVQADTSTQK